MNQRNWKIRFLISISWLRTKRHQTYTSKLSIQRALVLWPSYGCAWYVSANESVLSLVPNSRSERRKVGTKSRPMTWMVNWDQSCTVARRCISANAIHFPSSIELDIRYFAIGYTVFNAAVTAASLRSPKTRFRSVQRYCAHRNLSFALCSCTALTETQVSLCAAVLRSPKPKFRSVQRYCAHRNPGFALCSGTALTETQVLLCAAVLHSPKQRFRSVQRYCTHRNKGLALCRVTVLTLCC